MKKFIAALSGTLLSALVLNAAAQPGQLSEQYKAKLEAINRSREEAFVKKDIDGIMKFYDRDAICMPEYHPMLVKRKNIQDYFQDLFNAASVTNYKKEIYEVQVLDKYLIETGTFIEDLIRPERASFIYDGKYIAIWKIGEKDRLMLVSEIWGANGAIDRSELPLSVELDPEEELALKPVLDGRAAEEVNRLNREVARLIIRSDGAAMASYYTDDAIYMPYYMPMLIGIGAIKSYYIQHENPGTGIDSVQINAARITDLGAYVLEDGYYYVHWQAGNAKGIVTGKSISVWKRNGTGALKLYRQMVCHN